MVPRDDALCCLACGRSSLDLLVRSLQAQCHEVQQVLDQLAADDLVSPAGRGGVASLTYRITTAGRKAAAGDGRCPSALRSGDAVWATDDLYILRRLAETGSVPDEADTELRWDLGASLQYLWERGAVAITGLILPKARITPVGERAIRTEEGLS